MQATCWVVFVLMKSLNTTHVHMDPLPFSIPPVPIILFARKRSSPAFSSKGDFILRLQTGIELEDLPGMEATLVIGVDSQLSYRLLSFYSSCPTDFFMSYSVSFLYLKASATLTSFNFSLPTQWLCITLGCFSHLQFPQPTSSFYHQYTSVFPG